MACFQVMIWSSGWCELPTSVPDHILNALETKMKLIDILPLEVQIWNEVHGTTKEGLPLVDTNQWLQKENMCYVSYPWSLGGVSIAKKCQGNILSTMTFMGWNKLLSPYTPFSKFHFDVAGQKRYSWILHTARPTFSVCQPLLASRLAMTHWCPTKGSWTRGNAKDAYVCALIWCFSLLYHKLDKLDNTPQFQDWLLACIHVTSILFTVLSIRGDTLSTHFPPNPGSL